MAAITLEKFHCEGETSSIGLRWERWKRALHVYLEVSAITDSQKKRASLLHFGGIELQEIYYNIPGADAEPGVGIDVFAIALAKLDDYFAPKQSTVYERHVFRLMKQEQDEKFEKFLLRLRQQADKCNYKDKDEHIIDQITEKCLTTELRKKILQMGQQVTLDKIITEANSLETVQKQLNNFVGIGTNAKQEINKIDYRFKRRSERDRKGQTGCGRCGNPKHTSHDPDCPARTKDCLKCGLRGHFRQFCKTKQAHKRKIANEAKSKQEDDNHKKRKLDTRDVNVVSQVKDQKSKQEMNYIFHIDDDVEFDCTVGEVTIKMLVDSGCKQNLITSDTWNLMKQNQALVYNQIRDPDIKFTAYGAQTPLKVKGSFEALICVGNKSQNAIFYVIENGTRNLLGKITATAMGILKIGLDLEINSLESKLPKFKNVLIELPIDDSVPAVSQPYRRIPIPLEEKVEAKLEALTQSDIIEKVTGSSRWVSPIVPILKENGELRLCVDMRRANEAIVRENHPLPTMDKLLPKIQNATYFSKLDIKDAFHQIEIHPDTRHITTFITSKGLYRYKRLMFGISCAPELFQKTLEQILLGCDGVINSIDDILVFGRDLAEHDARLSKVLETLRDNDVMLRQDKCMFRVKKICFLGHELSEHGIKPMEKYVSTIQSFEPPKTVAELQSFLGLVNFVSKWVPDYGTLTEPLKQLLRGRNNLPRGDIQEFWGSEQQQAFDSLKLNLSNISTLGYYKVTDRTMVIADASPVALGGVLIQVDAKGPRVIAYGHKTLTDCERRYCQTEKEALALVWAVEHFHIFLYGKDFELITDHKPLEVIFGPKSKPCARIERWVLRLQCYRYKVVYKPGKNNIADPLSRLCKIPDVTPVDQENYINQIVEHTRPTAVSLQEIQDHSKSDAEIQAVRNGIYCNDWAEEVQLFKIFQNELCFHEDILLRNTKIVIPKELRDRVLKAAHEGHPGIVAMKARLRTKVWWPKCDKDAENLVKSCKGCTLVSAPPPPNPMKRRQLPEEAWVDIAIDLMGPLPKGDYLLVVVDYFSRYKEIKICRRITSDEIVEKLAEIFSRTGNPVSITADNGKQFVSETFRSFCRERNISIFNTVPYWPQMNGEVERQNRDILKRLKISQVEGREWRDCLLEYLVMYNSTPHTVTGKTPSELFYQRKFRDKLPMLKEANNRLEYGEIKDRDQEKKEKGKSYADRKRKAEHSNLGPGDKVYVKNMNKQNKLSLDYDTSTHTVEKRTGGDVEVRNDSTGQTYRRNVIHLKKVEGEWKVCHEETKEREGNDTNMEEEESI